MDEKTLISLIDLTRLVEDDDISSINTLLSKASNTLGHVAAVCIYPAYIKHAKQYLVDTPIRIATVANFPTGDENLSDVIKNIEKICIDGAHEIDVVMPYKQLQKNNMQHIQQFLKACRQATPEQTLKVIIESSALSATHVQLASQLVIDAGADFIKTSTGKSAGGATQQAVELMCEALKNSGSTETGIKISGGVRTTEDVDRLLKPIQNYFSQDWIIPQHVRIGTSQLVDTLLLS